MCLPKESKDKYIKKGLKDNNINLKKYYIDPIQVTTPQFQPVIQNFQQNKKDPSSKERVNNVDIISPEKNDRDKEPPKSEPKSDQKDKKYVPMQELIQKVKNKGSSSNLISVNIENKDKEINKEYDDLSKKMEEKMDNLEKQKLQIAGLVKENSSNNVIPGNVSNTPGINSERKRTKTGDKRIPINNNLKSFFIAKKNDESQSTTQIISNKIPDDQKDKNNENGDNKENEITKLEKENSKKSDKSEHKEIQRNIYIFVIKG